MQYQKELQRVQDLRKSSLSELFVEVRQEIAKLQNHLLLNKGEGSTPDALNNEEYSEELLKEEEDECQRLRDEVNAKGPVLKKVKEWIQLKRDEVKLSTIEADPDRFKKARNMLEEEKLRKRVEKLKPKIEAQLLATLPAWEEEHGGPFLAHGERVVDSIQNAIAEKAKARDAKKNARMGLAPRAASVRATPAQPASRVVSSTARSVSNTTRKRDAPTPCPPGGNGSTLKRSRIGQPSSRSTSSRPRAGGIPRMTAATPTPASGGRAFGQPALGALANGNTPQMTGPDPFKSRPITSHLIKSRPPGSSRRPLSAKSRTSFKPRPSLAAGLLRGVDVLEADEAGEAGEAEVDNVY